MRAIHRGHLHREQARLANALLAFLGMLVLQRDKVVEIAQVGGQRCFERAIGQLDHLVGLPCGPQLAPLLTQIQHHLAAGRDLGQLGLV